MAAIRYCDVKTQLLTGYNGMEIFRDQRQMRITTLRTRDYTQSPYVTTETNSTHVRRISPINMYPTEVWNKVLVEELSF